jgi:hypothetical protein
MHFKRGSLGIFEIYRRVLSQVGGGKNGSEVLWSDIDGQDAIIKIVVAARAKNIFVAQQN